MFQIKNSGLKYFHQNTTNKKWSRFYLPNVRPWKYLEICMRCQSKTYIIYCIWFKTGCPWVSAWCETIDVEKTFLVKSLSRTACSWATSKSLRFGLLVLNTWNLPNITRYHTWNRDSQVLKSVTKFWNRKLWSESYRSFLDNNRLK